MKPACLEVSACRPPCIRPASSSVGKDEKSLTALGTRSRNIPMAFNKSCLFVSIKEVTICLQGLLLSFQAQFQLMVYPCKVLNGLRVR